MTVYFSVPKFNCWTGSFSNSTKKLGKSLDHILASTNYSYPAVSGESMVSRDNKV